MSKKNQQGFHNIIIYLLGQGLKSMKYNH